MGFAGECSAGALALQQGQPCGRDPPNEEPKKGEPALSQSTTELAGLSEGGLVGATHQIPNSTAACHVTNWESTSLNFLAKCYRLISLKFELDFIPYN